ncbi:hypothetical protein [Pilimelia columellifera]|uniref:hypothetical protein n=1 Tax=Pilimelia columellifera TaxID=706574 RepID=UPI0031E3F67A
MATLVVAFMAGTAPDVATAETADAGRAAGPVATPAAISDADVEVVAVRPLPGGRLERTSYRAAPGVTARQLRERLTRDGVRGIADPSALTATEDPYSCFLGTAYALDNGRCPPIRWTWAGYYDPQVYFRDRTGPAWPVRETVRDWNQAVGIDSYWTTGACPDDRHCVNVHSADYGGTGWSGATSFTITYGRNFVDGTVVVRLNDRYATGAADRRSSTCHELGHALGVGHNLSQASCMFAKDTNANPTRPHPSDFNLLRRVIYP